MRAWLPTVLVSILICAFAGAAVGDARAQSETGAAARPLPAEGRVNPGLAPPMPCLGGRASVCCDHPDLAYHPRCLEWRPNYERWRRAFDAYYRR